ncbi:class I SAM-dependent methyltransferase [Pseudodesulfovibrio sediminis]|uniref:Methyltransferase type 11 n=1 Tax=Pseudodesulfovibrio sediminis TaxID=2810563 RepID=A0ABM7P8A9_9BACT|nr:class I SAM-dependent methyltransferase [Pseudodesulfovibrio sediminis]BCS89229.1 methyltransferase type 11 [Pseudodesulfovibrio sediminis]
MDEYSRYARLYDFLITPAMRPMHGHMHALLTEHRCTTIAELCCGTGAMAGQLDQAGMTVIGVDSSAAMLRVARKKRPSVHFIQANASTLPLPDRQFDAATISFALHEKPQPTAHAILTEARRIVRPDGMILVTDYRLPKHGSGAWAGRCIATIERIAGKEHHAHFSRYMAGGGTDTFLKQAGLDAQCTETFMSGWAGVYLAR